ncbi:hypothetical protein CI00_08745 [Leptospira interrogans serovar Manilae]|nr:hypothetical protein CI00_08745 [Leptospira interrogans serovar Manilae]
MDRRSGLKKAHFSSVPTRMSLFTCKKYVFLIEKNFPNLTTPSKNRGTQHNALYESRCGMGTKFYRGFVVIPTDLY